MKFKTTKKRIKEIINEEVNSFLKNRDKASKRNGKSGKQKKTVDAKTLADIIRKEIEKAG